MTETVKVEVGVDRGGGAAMSDRADRYESRCVDLRAQFGLRSDLGWVREVAAAGDCGGMVLGIPLTTAERDDVEGRSDRLGRVVEALQEASFDSDAGAWIDQRAGGVLHVLLADPSPQEQETVQTLTAGIPVVVESVSIPRRELERLQEQVREQLRSDPDFSAAFVSSGVQIRDNVVRVLLRTGTDTAVAARLLAVTGDRGVEVGYTSMEWRAE